MSRLIVYIEDDPGSIALMEDLASNLDGVSVLTAPTAEIGLELVRARHPAALILDLQLPGMNGAELIARLHAWPETQSIPVIALGATGRMDDAKQAAAAGFHRYLTQPISVDELLATLEPLLEAC